MSYLLESYKRDSAAEPSVVAQIQKREEEGWSLQHMALDRKADELWHRVLALYVQKEAVAKGLEETKAVTDHLAKMRKEADRMIADARKQTTTILEAGRYEARRLEQEIKELKKKASKEAPSENVTNVYNNEYEVPKWLLPVVLSNPLLLLILTLVVLLNS